MHALSVSNGGYKTRAERRRRAIGFLLTDEVWSDQDKNVSDDIDEAKDVLAICRRVVSNEKSYCLEDIEEADSD